jgi:transcriptional regulator with XRE-family HTH domain
MMRHVATNNFPAVLKELSVPQRIRWLRKQAGSHDKLAAMVGTTRQVVIRWEHGQKPSAESRQRLARASGLPVSAFQEDEEEDEEDAELHAALVQLTRLIIERACEERVVL